MLIAHSPVKRGKDRILLCGHSDIVKLDNFHKLTIRGDKYYGSGVADMKGGLTVMVEILKRLAAGKKLFNITCIITPDEEQGSQVWQPFLSSLYQRYRYALVFEPALEINKGEWEKERWLVTRRRGVKWLEFELKGRGGHAGNDKAKDNVIVEMSKKVIEWNKLNALFSNFSLNVGVIEGGEQANVIPDRCSCRLDVRTADWISYRRAERLIKKIFRQGKRRWQRTEKVVLEIPPLEENDNTKRLKKIAAKVWRRHGLKMINLLRGGASDGNHLGTFGVGVLDALGPVGGGMHTAKEWIYKRSLDQSVRLASEIILAIDNY